YMAAAIPFVIATYSLCFSATKILGKVFAIAIVTLAVFFSYQRDMAIYAAEFGSEGYREASKYVSTIVHDKDIMILSNNLHAGYYYHYLRQYAKPLNRYTIVPVNTDDEIEQFCKTYSPSQQHIIIMEY